MSLFEPHMTAGRGVPHAFGNFKAFPYDTLLAGLSSSDVYSFQPLFASHPMAKAPGPYANMMPFASSVQFAFAEAACPEQFHALAATQDSGSQVNTPQLACPTGYPSDVDTRTLGRSGRKQPIRVSHVGPSFVCAGVESWLRALVSHCDPTIMRIVRNVVTEEYAVDHELLQQLGIPYSLGREQAVRDAAMESDVVMVWGKVNPEDLRPPGSTAKVVFVAHGVGDWTRAALEACHPAIDHVVAVSDCVRKTVCSGYPTSVILNGVDQRHIASRKSGSEMRQSLGFAETDFIVGYAGRFSPEKRAHLVIEAVRNLPANTKALFVGWGPLRYDLMDLCNELIPGRFAFATSRSFLGDHYQIMNALCMPSEAEGFGLVAAEAMLHSVPVISSPVGIASDLFVHRVNGLLAKPDEFEMNLRQLQQNRDWATGLGRQGRQTALDHCLGSRMTRQYEMLLQSLVDPCHTGRQ